MVHGTAAPSSIGQRQQGYAAPIQNSMVYGQAQDRYAHTGASTQNSMVYGAVTAPSGISQGLLNRWTSQLDLGCTTGGLERVVSVHNST